MISNRWIGKRQASWDRMAALMTAAGRHGARSLSREELRELALLYRQIANDLSVVRQDGTALAAEANLNQLLAQAHSFLYSGHKPTLRIVWRFLSEDYPRLFRRLLPFTLVSLLLFLGGAALGALLTSARPEFMRHLLGPEMVRTIERHEMWTQSVTSMAPQASSGIMTNNLGVTFFAFAAGITGGLGTLYVIGWNGLLLGVVATACHQSHMSVKLWSFVAPHGALELPAIVIAGGAGLRLAQGLLFPGIYRRGYSLAAAGADSARLLAGTVPVLAIAGAIEGFFSPSAAPFALKICVGVLLFAALLAWLGSARGEPSASGAVEGASDQTSALSLISR